MTEAEIKKKWENTVWDTDVYLDELDGKEPMTNEEYLRTANVDDMATMIATKLLELARHEYGMCDVVDREIVLEWLKQPHK